MNCMVAMGGYFLKKYYLCTPFGKKGFHSFGFAKGPHNQGKNDHSQQSSGSVR